MTQWATTLHSNVNLHHIMDFRAVSNGSNCGRASEDLAGVPLDSALRLLIASLQTRYDTIPFPSRIVSNCAVWMKQTPVRCRALRLFIAPLQTRYKSISPKNCVDCAIWKKQTPLGCRPHSRIRPGASTKGSLERFSRGGGTWVGR